MDLFKAHNIMETSKVKPATRRPLKSKEESFNATTLISQPTNTFKKLLTEVAYLSENEDSSDNDSTEYDKQMIDSSDVSEKESSAYFTPEQQKRSTSIFSERSKFREKRSKSREKRSPSKPKLSSNNKQDANNFLLIILFPVIFLLIAVSFVMIVLMVKDTEEKSMNNSNLELSIAIEKLKAQFYNQEPDIWDDISSGINEVKISNPKIPSIILLFANETHTMDCLASALADVGNAVLGGDSPLHLEAKTFGNDPGEIISTLKKTMIKKKAVIIYDVLSINAEAIKALHNLCDKVNPLVREVVYIITMRTKNYKSSQKKMAFVEHQIYHELSKSIDNDILMALVTRITDGAIISVQPQPNLRYCSILSTY